MELRYKTDVQWSKKKGYRFRKHMMFIIKVMYIQQYIYYQKCLTYFSKKWLHIFGELLSIAIFRMFEPGIRNEELTGSVTDLDPVFLGRIRLFFIEKPLISLSNGSVPDSVSRSDPGPVLLSCVKSRSDCSLNPDPQPGSRAVVPKKILHITMEHS